MITAATILMALIVTVIGILGMRAINDIFECEEYREQLRKEQQQKGGTQ